MNKIRANQIATFALKARKSYLGVSASTPICSYNLADSMGMDLRFVKIASFEGMYLTDDKVILISAERPEGRKRFTCAHEIGHHVLKHGTVIDEIIESGSNKEIEREADFFASMLLMPSSLIRSAVNSLDIDLEAPCPEKLYVMSKYIGISFEALLTQLRINLGLISNSTYQYLKKVKLAEVKQKIYPNIEKGRDVFVVGQWWKGKAVDAVDGDIILLDQKYEIEGASIAATSEHNTIKCIAPGISKISTEDWACFVRVSKAGFAGMYQYMHIEEVE